MTDLLSNGAETPVVAAARNRAAAPLAGDDSAIGVEDLGPPVSRQRAVWIVRLLSVFGFLLAWEIAGRAGNELMLSYPTAIARAARAMIGTGELEAAILASCKTLLSSLAIATVSGISLGLLMGRYHRVDAALSWLCNALYATPHIAIVPLVIVWFGIGSGAKIFLVTLVAVFPILMNTLTGVRNVPASVLDVGAAFGASERETFRKIILPSVMPYIVTGLRLAIGRGIIGTVAAEFFTGISGLGAQIVKFGNRYDTASMFVPIIILMIVGISMSALLSRFERWVAPWRQTES